MSLATTLTNKVIDFIYRNGGYAWRAESSGIFDRKIGGYRTAPKKGVADILAIVRPKGSAIGQLLAIEIKIGKDHLSPEQTGFLANVSHYGGLSVVVNNYEQFISWWTENVK